MPKFFVVCLLLVFTAGLTACDPMEDQNLKAAVQEGNSQISAYQKDRRTLKSQYSIEVEQEGATHFVPRQLTLNDLRQARVILLSMISHAQRAIDASKHDGVVDATGLIPRAQAHVEDAQYWLAVVDQRIADLQRR